MKEYGKELIIDLHNCDVSRMNRHYIRRFFNELCVLIDMQKGPLRFWDDVGVEEQEKQTDPHLVGTSAVQFILTSSIVLHALNLLGSVYLNVFSCKDFDSKVVADFSMEYWSATLVQTQADIERSLNPDGIQVSMSTL